MTTPASKAAVSYRAPHVAPQLSFARVVTRGPVAVLGDVATDALLKAGAAIPVHLPTPIAGRPQSGSIWAARIGGLVGGMAFVLVAARMARGVWR